MIKINPSRDPRRIEFWVGTRLQIGYVDFVEIISLHLKNFSPDDDNYQDLVAMQYFAGINKVKHPDVDGQWLVHLKFGDYNYQGDVRDNAIHFIVLAKDGLAPSKAYQSSDVYPLHQIETSYVDPSKRGWDMLMEPIQETIKEFLNQYPQLNYDFESGKIEYDLDVEFFEVEDEKGRDPRRNKKGGPKPGTRLPVPDSLTTLQLTNVEGFEHGSEDLIIRLDVDGNFEARSNEDWGEGDIARVLAQALVHIHSGNCHE